MKLEEVQVGQFPLERFRDVIGAEDLERALQTAADMRERLDGRVIWNLNSTAVGGGVAEMLQSLLCYTRGLGIDTRWVVIRGEGEFFRVTKRLHHALHGSAGDGSPLGEAEREIYEETMRDNAAELTSVIGPRDVVLLHDPQTAGLAPHLKGRGAHLVWRCHIGPDRSGPDVELGWDFLAPYLDHVGSYVFSRKAYVPERYDHGKSWIIQPSIDAFSPKNQQMEEPNVHTILVHTGLVEGPPPPGGSHGFVREDGSPSRVSRRADVVRFGRAPRWDTPLIVQVSRWDPLKDPIGVMLGFAALVEGGGAADSELVLAGPNVSAVADDPEGARSWDDTVDAWRQLPESVRDRVHLACLPMHDIQENAAIVNALQRHASIVVQKSLHEGFGLTVTEAMWKSRPVVGSAVGGIQDQIEDGRSGVLLQDPSDLTRFAGILGELLGDRPLRDRLGKAAHERVRSEFLGVEHLEKYARLIAELDKMSEADRAD